MKEEEELFYAYIDHQLAQVLYTKRSMSVVPQPVSVFCCRSSLSKAMDELEQLDFLPSCGIVKEEEEESNTHRSSAGSDSLPECQT